MLKKKTNKVTSIYIHTVTIESRDIARPGCNVLSEEKTRKEG